MKLLDTAKGGTVTLLIFFAIGYAIGGVSTLTLIGLMLASRERERVHHRRLIRHDA